MPCSIGLQAQFDCRLANFEYCTLNSMPVNVWKPTRLCQGHSVIIRNAYSCFEALNLSCETVMQELKVVLWHSNCHLINMPGLVPAAVKARKTPQEKEDNLQKALEEYLKTQDQKPPPSQDAIARQFGVPRLTLSAWIKGHPSKLASASQWQKIYPDEEQLIIDYLQETACRGFLDTQVWCIWRVNEILVAQSGNKDICSSWHSLAWLLPALPSW